jgi:hypothetical protein
MNGAPISRFIPDDGLAVALNSTGNLAPPYNSSFWSHALFFNAKTSGDTEHTISIIVDEVSLTFPFHFDPLMVTGAEGRRNVIIDADPTILYTGGLGGYSFLQGILRYQSQESYRRWNGKSAV